MSTVKVAAGGQTVSLPYTVSTPPSGHGTPLGASVANVANLQRLRGFLGGPLPAARRFFTGAPPAKWSDDAILSTLPVNCRVVVSWKSGVPSAVGRFLASRPAGVVCDATFNHEPENDPDKQTAAGKAKFFADWASYAPAIRAAGCTPTLILMRWTLAPASGRHFTDWYPVGSVDQLGWDAYDPTWDAKTNPSYEDPAQILAPILALAQSTGLPWGLGECGSPIIGTDAGARAAWAAQLAAAIKAGGAQFACWWDQKSNTSAFDNTMDAQVGAVWH